MRRTPLARGTTELSRVTQLHRTEPLADVIVITGGAQVLPLRKPLNPVSKKRARQNRERAAMADRLWPDRREGTVLCGCGRPECQRPADDLHETLSRARGGSITDEADVVPLARECHDEVTFTPESELGWAYDCGLLVHSWGTDGGDAA